MKKSLSRQWEKRALQNKARKQQDVAAATHHRAANELDEQVSNTTTMMCCDNDAEELTGHAAVRAAVSDLVDEAPVAETAAGVREELDDDVLNEHHQEQGDGDGDGVDGTHSRWKKTVEVVGSVAVLAAYLVPVAVVASALVLGGTSSKVQRQQLTTTAVHHGSAAINVPQPTPAAPAAGPTTSLLSQSPPAAVLVEAHDRLPQEREKLSIRALRGK